MGLDKILAISGKPGLFKVVTQTRSGFVAESLIDKKKIPVNIHSNVSILSEIAIYTLEEELPLREVFKKIKGKKAIVIGKKDWIVDMDLLLKKVKGISIETIIFSEGHMSHIENKSELSYFLKHFSEK